MENHLLILESDISSAVQQALEEIETGAYNATQRGIEVLLDGTCNFSFAVIRPNGENAVELNSTTTNPEVISTSTDTIPEIVSTTLREEPQDTTTVTDALPEDQTITLDSAPEVVIATAETGVPGTSTTTAIDGQQTTTGKRNLIAATTRNSKSGSDKSNVDRKYDEF